MPARQACSCPKRAGPPEKPENASGICAGWVYRLTNVPHSVYKRAMASTAIEFLEMATNRRENVMAYEKEDHSDENEFVHFEEEELGGDPEEVIEEETEEELVISDRPGAAGGAQAPAAAPRAAARKKPAAKSARKSAAPKAKKKAKAAPKKSAKKKPAKKSAKKSAKRRKKR